MQNQQNEAEHLLSEYWQWNQLSARVSALDDIVTEGQGKTLTDTYENSIFGVIVWQMCHILGFFFTSQNVKLRDMAWQCEIEIK